MSCSACTSANRLEFGAEMIIHFPGMEGLDEPAVWAFPRLLVCMGCGRTEFTIPDTALAALADGIREHEPNRQEIPVALGPAIRA